MPRDPLRLGVGLLDVAHGIDKLVVHAKIRLVAEEAWDNPDVIVCHLLGEPRLARVTHPHAHMRPHKRGARVEGVRVASIGRLGLSDTPTRVVVRPVI
eukprot:scaffold25786_cov26-Tisochrysis_lutea.AAC.2